MRKLAHIAEHMDFCNLCDNVRGRWIHLEHKWIHKPVRCPGQAWGFCSEDCHSAKICANAVTVLVWAEDAKVSYNKTLSGEKENTLTCAVPSKSFDKSSEGDCIALALQLGDLPVIVIMEHRATCFIHR